MLASPPPILARFRNRSGIEKPICSRIGGYGRGGCDGSGETAGRDRGGRVRQDGGGARLDPGLAEIVPVNGINTLWLVDPAERDAEGADPAALSKHHQAARASLG